MQISNEQIETAIQQLVKNDEAHIKNVELIHEQLTTTIPAMFAERDKLMEELIANYTRLSNLVTKQATEIELFKAKSLHGVAHHC
jgi:hypothetical protein